MKKTFIYLFSLASLTFIFCSTSSAQSDTTLYSRLTQRCFDGSMKRNDCLEPIVGETLANILQDKMLVKKLAKTNFMNLKVDFLAILCNKTGGNCQLPASKPIELTDAEWQSGLEDAKKAIVKFVKNEKEQNELIEIVKTLRNDFFVAKKS